MARIFISHSPEDRLFVDEFVPLLRHRYGHDTVWVGDSVHGDQWQPILNEIATCQLFVYLISNDSLASSFCQAEIREALRLQKAILPVIIRPNTPYPGAVADDLKAILQNTRYVDLSRGVNDYPAITEFYGAVNYWTGLVPPAPPAFDRPQRRPKVSWMAVVLIAALIIIIVLIAMMLFAPVDNNSAQSDNESGTEAVLAFDPITTPTPTPTIILYVSSIPTISAAHLGRIVSARALDRAGCPVDSTTRFSPSDPIYIVAENSMVSVGTTVFARLYYNGAPIEDSDVITADQNYSNTCINFAFEPGTQFEPGSYEAEFIVNGNPTESVSFEVE